MPDKPAYSVPQFVLAVNSSIVLAWAFISFGLGILFRAVWTIEFWSIAAAAGLPIGLILGWLIGAPLLQIVMRRSVSWRDAVIYGAAIGAILGFSVWVFAIAAGRLTLNNDAALGALVLIVAFAGTGVVVSLVMRAAIGPGNSDMVE